MSTSTVEKQRTELAAADQDRRIWHNPLTIDDLLAGLHGMPFTAMCGRRCHPRGGGVRVGVTGIERCQVCQGLVDGGQRIAL